MRGAATIYGVGVMGASLPHSLPSAQGLFTAAGLAGEWTVARRIEDARTGGTARLQGTARFTVDADGLVYDETGTLTLDSGQSFAASRRYLWRFGGDMIRVLFDDGRLFHLLDPARPEDEQVHLCGPDTYRGHYTVAADHWTTTWRVSGPRKDQVNRITYHR